MLGPAEPRTGLVPPEVGVVVSVLARTQELATAICAFVRGPLHFGDYPGRTSTAGNVATLFSPDEIEMGAAYVWSIWHALGLDDPVESFPIKVMQFPNPEWEAAGKRLGDAHRGPHRPDIRHPRR